MAGDGATVSVRRLEPGDAAAYRRMMLEAYAAHPEAFTSTAGERASLPEAWWESRLSLAADAPEVVFGACEGGDLLGVAGVNFSTRDRLHHKATLFGMYVPAAQRQRGIGRQLVAAVLDQARERGARVVQLTVTQGNEAALALYEACGFASWGLEPLAVGDGSDFFSKLHMWRDLGDEEKAPASSRILVDRGG